MAHDFINIGKYEQGVEFLNKSLKEIVPQESDSTNLKSSIYFKIGQCYEKTNKPDSAIKYYELSLDASWCNRSLSKRIDQKIDIIYRDSCLYKLRNWLQLGDCHRDWILYQSLFEIYYLKNDLPNTMRVARMAFNFEMVGDWTMKAYQSLPLAKALLKGNKADSALILSRLYFLNLRVDDTIRYAFRSVFYNAIYQVYDSSIVSGNLNAITDSLKCKVINGSECLVVTIFDSDYLVLDNVTCNEYFEKEENVKIIQSRLQDSMSLRRQN